MNDSEQEREKFSMIMIGVAENFSAQISSPGLRLSFMALKDYSIQQIEAAALKILNTRKAMGMPTVNEFHVAINGERKAGDNAQKQVAHVMGQIRDVGSYGFPVIEDPITKILMSSRWNFRSLCLMTEAELKWWARDFIEAYQAFERREECLAIGMECTGEKNFRDLKLLAGGIGN